MIGGGGHLPRGQNINNTGGKKSENILGLSYLIFCHWPGSHGVIRFPSSPRAFSLNVTSSETIVCIFLHDPETKAVMRTHNRRMTDHAKPFYKEVALKCWHKKGQFAIRELYKQPTILRSVFLKYLLKLNPGSISSWSQSDLLFWDVLQGRLFYVHKAPSSVKLFLTLEQSIYRDNLGSLLQLQVNIIKVYLPVKVTGVTCVICYCNRRTLEACGACQTKMCF